MFPCLIGHQAAQSADPPRSFKSLTPSFPQQHPISSWVCQLPNPTIGLGDGCRRQIFFSNLNCSAIQAALSTALSFIFLLYSSYYLPIDLQQYCGRSLSASQPSEAMMGGHHGQIWALASPSAQEIVARVPLPCFSWKKLYAVVYMVPHCPAVVLRPVLAGVSLHQGSFSKASIVFMRWVWEIMWWNSTTPSIMPR